jgi:hypothetical protein
MLDQIGCDYQIYNDSGFDWLEYQVREVMKEVLSNEKPSN